MLIRQIENTSFPCLTTGSLKMQLPILLVKKNSLFGTIPPEERRTLGTVTFCSTAVTETGDVDEFFFHFENGIVVCVERVGENIEELRRKNHDV